MFYVLETSHSPKIYPELFKFTQNLPKTYSELREGFKKKYGIFHTLVGWVGLKKSFSAKKNMVSKCIKSPKYSFKSNLFFSYGGWGLTLRIFLRSKWLLDLPDLEIFLSILDFFNGKK